MIDWFVAGGVFMWPVSLAGLVGLALAADAVLRVLGRDLPPGAVPGRTARIDAVLFWGVLSALLGVLGTLVGIAMVADAMAASPDASVELALDGLAVTLHTTTLGLGLLALSLVAWAGLRAAGRRRRRGGEAEGGTGRRPPATGALLLAVLLPPAAACGGEPEGPSAVRDSAGVRIVENTVGSRPLGAKVIHLTDLIPPDSTLGARPWGIAASPEAERIYLADRRGRRVVMFDREGAFAGGFGRPGGGPGEFQQPAALTIGPDGSVVVWDTGRGLLSEWSAEGKLLDERQPRIGYWGPGFALGRDRLYTVTSSRASRCTRDQHLVVKRGEDRETLHTVARELVAMDLCFSAPAPEIYAPDVVWTARSDTVYVRHGPGYRIDVRADVELVESVRRRMEPTEVTREMAVRRARFGPGPYRSFMRRCGVGPEEIVAEVGHREVVSPVMDVAVDPAGRLWVTRSVEGIEPDSLDLFGSDGTYRGTVGAPGVPVGFLSPDRFAAMRLDRETGRAVVGLYQVRGGPEPGTGEAARTDADGRRGEATSSDGGTDGSGAARPAWAPPVREDLREFRDCEGCPVVVELPAGTFTMGAPEGEAPAEEIPTRPAWTEAAERPRVEVTVEEPFAIGKHEVTFAQWNRCVEAGGCEHEPRDEGWGRGDRPVIHVSRTDAKRYAAWLSERAGETYRLPSEAEWEYAARAGTETARWWGDELGEGRVPCDGCGTRWDRKSTTPVGSFPANPWGLHDMLSNVSEWVADCWHDDHRGHPGDASARVESSEWWRPGGWEERRGQPCRRPVTRGGAYGYFPWTIRAAHRGYWWPSSNWTEREGRSRGFRLVRELTEETGERGMSGGR